MQILLLGATGRTGKHVLQEALQRGHTVHALVRDKHKFAIAGKRLLVFEGSPLDKTVLRAAMQGCEAVLSALNISRTSDWPWAKLRSPKDLLSATMRNIIETAPGTPVRRVIFTSARGAAETIADIPAWFRWFIKHSNIRYPYEDHARQEELVSQSPLEWTSVRLAGLTNHKKKEVVVSINNNPKPNLLISRRSAAAFMLDILEKNQYVNEKVIVSGK